MRRFYKLAEVAAVVGGFSVTLDGKGIRTPAGRFLVVPHAALAEAIAGEWLAQEEMVDTHSMPLTQLASTAIDRVGPSRDVIVEQLMNYAGTDLLCYRAGSPRDLVERQTTVWQPVLDWALASLGARMVVTEGILPVEQPEDAIAALRRVVDGYDVLRLTALQNAVAALGSLLLGLAVVEGRLGWEEGYAASQLDETYQIELWGEDPEATKRRNGLRNDVAASARFLELCLPQHPPMHS